VLRAGKLLLQFAYLEALSCIFPAFIFASLLAVRLIPDFGIAAYDLMLILCIAAQIVMVWTGLESKDELKVICLFHVIGLALEIFKTSMGSWAYPEDAATKVFGVPLYSGFMYASVASYLCQAWRRLDIELHRYPAAIWTSLLGIAIYANFMTHHWIWDMRWWLTGLLFILFARSYVTFRVSDARFRMPLVVAFFLVGFFIWIAENIATLLSAWQYPNQQDAWQFVSFGKISSWFLLVIVSFILVAQLKHVKGRRSDPHAHFLDAS